MFDFLKRHKETCFSRNPDMANVFSLLSSLTPDQTLRDDFLYKLEKLKTSRSADIFAFTQLYLDWENLLLSHQKINLKESFTANLLREKIKHETSLEKVDIAFSLIFEKKELQIIYLSELFLHFISQYIVENLGLDVLVSTNTSLAINEISEKVVITKDGFDFRQFNVEVLQTKSQSLQQILSLFKVYFEIFAERIEVSFGGEITHHLFNSVYEKLHKMYNSELISNILVIIPERVLNLDEWLSMLSKGELEGRVKAKTAELEELNKQLETKVEERVVELKQAYKNLQELDQRKSEFISLVGHQMRTPVVAVKWALSMLKDQDMGVLSETQKKLVDDAYLANESMNNVINEILIADDIMNHSLSYNIEPVDLALLVDNVLSLASDIIKRKNLVIRKEIETKEMVSGDREKLKYVFTALLDNAIRYSAPGSEVVCLLKKDHDMLSISIIDHGIGIPSEVQNRIGDRFFRADNALRQNTYGSGLGLYIVKNIIESCGGRLKVESQEGKGTTITIHLNIHKS
jgi:signal transduction histidine kinase